MDKHTANIFIGFILIITIYGLQLKPSEPFSNYTPPPPRIKTMTEHTPTLKCNRSTNPTSNCYTLKPNYWKQYQSHDVQITSFSERRHHTSRPPSLRLMARVEFKH